MYIYIYRYVYFVSAVENWYNRPSGKNSETFSKFKCFFLFGADSTIRLIPGQLASCRGAGSVH